MSMRYITAWTAASASIIAVAVVGCALAAVPGETAAVPGVVQAGAGSATPRGTPNLIVGEVRLDAGRYLMGGMGDRGRGFAIEITVPDGWSSLEDFSVRKDYGPTEAQAGPGLGVWPISNRYVNACTDHTLLDPPPGPSIDDLIEAIARQPGVTSAEPTAVMIDGYPGKSVEVTVATDITTCGAQAFWIWGSAGDPRFVQGNDEVNRIYVLDIDGTRETFFARIPAMTTATDRAELEGIIASIEIQPR